MFAANLGFVLLFVANPQKSGLSRAFRNETNRRVTHFCHVRIKKWCHVRALV